MNSISFDQVNKVYKQKPDSTEFGPAYNQLEVCAKNDSEGFPVEISCWEVSCVEEMTEFIMSGRIYLGANVLDMPPVYLSAINPLDTDEEVLSQLERNRSVSGCVDIIVERINQIDGHGYDTEHDYKYVNGELKQMAMFCIDGICCPEFCSDDLRDKILSKTEEERLAIAGAFIAAHIDLIRYQKKINESEN